MVGSASTPQTISRASTAFWSRCSGPIDEASSGETSLGVGVGDVLDVGGRVVEGNGLES